MYVLRGVFVLTGCPWYHCGLNFSSLLRVKDAFLLGSYILLSMIPWDSGYSPCNWEHTLLQCYKEKEPSSYANRRPLDKHVQWITYTWLLLHQYLKTQLQQHRLPLLPSSTFQFLVASWWDLKIDVYSEAITYAGPPSHDQNLGISKENCTSAGENHEISSERSAQRHQLLVF